jgi:8-oxo-dGTP pyrophosphatase MutT (NUDIX family)
MRDELPTSRAAGFVLTREGASGREYLLLVNRRDGQPGLPKGHAHGAEDDLATARRETLEETGLGEAALDVDPFFRAEISYRVKKDGQHRLKTVVYFRARLLSGEVRLSHEHTSFSWLGLKETLARITFDSLRSVVWRAALHGKDPALFRMVPPDPEAAERHLVTLPHASEGLVGHLRGASRLARLFASALLSAGSPVDVEATGIGALLHDAGRALGHHEDHQLAGIRHLRSQRRLAPYGFACISHFTKGATPEELRAAGLGTETVAEFCREIDLGELTPEEACAALADSCMRGPDAVAPPKRFEDLRRRYGAGPLIDLQERRTTAIRTRIAEATGSDPLVVAGLA